MAIDEKVEKVVVPGVATPGQSEVGDNKDREIKESGRSGDPLYGTIIK